jgi:hypothetical protein
MIFSGNTKPKGADAPVKLRHILADKVKPMAFDFNRNRYAETHPKRKPGGPLMTSQLGDIAATKKRAEVAAIPDVSAAKATPVKKKAGRPKKK